MLRSAHYRNANRESRTLISGAFYGYATMMILDYAITNTQAKTGPLAKRFCGEKGVKYPVDHRTFYAGPVITEADFDCSSDTFDADTQASAGRHSVEGIQHEVKKNLLHLVRINVHIRNIRDLRPELDIPETLVVFDKIQCSLKDVRNTAGHLVRRRDAGEITQAPDDPHNPIDMGIDRHQGVMQEQCVFTLPLVYGP